MQIASLYAYNSEHGSTNNSVMYCLIHYYCVCVFVKYQTIVYQDKTTSNSSYVGHIDCQLRHKNVTSYLTSQ